MKLRTLLAAFSAVALAFGAVHAADKDEDTPLSKEMSAMNKSLRQLKKQLADASKKDENIGLVEKVEANIKNTHDLSPKKTEEQTDKPTYTKKFQDEMADLNKSIGELKEAIKADKPDDAKMALDKIYKLKEKGHKDFGVDD